MERPLPEAIVTVNAGFSAVVILSTCATVLAPRPPVLGLSNPELDAR